MIHKLHSFTILAGMAVLVASSQATITFSNYTSDFNPAPSNQISATPPQLSDFPSGAGTVTDSGSFDVAGSMGITELDVNEVDGFAIDGMLSLEVTLYQGDTTSSPVLETLYSESIVSAMNSGDQNALIPTFQDNYFLLPELTGTHAVSYTASFTGYDGDSLGYLGGFAVDAYEAVPEPSAYATLGLGVIGLLIRRRRSGK